MSAGGNRSGAAVTHTDLATRRHERSWLNGSDRHLTARLKRGLRRPLLLFVQQNSVVAGHGCRAQLR